MQTTTIYICRLLKIGFSKETSHLDVSIEHFEEIQMILFSKFANLHRLMIYPIIRIQQNTYICETKHQISRSGYLQFQL